MLLSQLSFDVATCRHAAAMPAAQQRKMLPCHYAAAITLRHAAITLIIFRHAADVADFAADAFRHYFRFHCDAGCRRLSAMPPPPCCFHTMMFRARYFAT